jgi:serine/threonine protein kinase/tetratricopeptide (TPR) repeat protein
MDERQRASEPPPTVLATVIAVPPERVGSVIGPYKLLQQLGEGGFGVVYLAEQDQPVRRQVALKIIKPGMDSAQVIARFESERQALALMDHPHIARVIDAGTTESGHPYFVMELVKGVPITEYCDKNHLSPEARLKLFLDVCQAIQHAHHKGIIHRDIKPSNVLVTLQDGVPVVKVIDFGVAKATAQRLTDRTLFTALGQMIGTPLYMSPEQAGVSTLDVDTRTDVYSLGVLLYELLTGTTPLEAKRLRQAALAEMQRLICEEESPRPSSRLSSLGDTASVVAVNRGLDLKRLTQLLAADLDWIVMKALEKDRNRRYDTPGAFAEDIDRYLRHDAIQARPPSRSYRLQKFMRRNRAAVLTAMIVVASLVTGTTVSAWQAVRATNAEDSALRSAASESLAKQEALAAASAERQAKNEATAAARAEKRAKDDALLAAAAEKKAKDEAVEREAEAKAVLAFVEKRIIAAAMPKGVLGGQGRDITLRQAIDTAVPYVSQSFPKQPLIEARLRLVLGFAFEALNSPDKSAEQNRAALALYTKARGPEHPDTIMSMGHLATSYDSLGRSNEALELREKVLALRKARLGPNHQDTILAMEHLANSYHSVGRIAEALELNKQALELNQATLGPEHSQTLANMNNLALSYDEAGRYVDALELDKRSFQILKTKVGIKNPDTLRIMQNLATDYEHVGKYREAMTLRGQALPLLKTLLGPDHHETLACMESLSGSYMTFGRPRESLEMQEEVVKIRTAKFGVDHPSTVASTHNLAIRYTNLGRFQDAVKVAEETLRRSKAKLGADHPRTLALMHLLAADYSGLGRNADALKLQEETLALRKAKLGPDHPDTLQTMVDLANSHFRLGHKAEAPKLYEAVLPLLKAKMGADHRDTLTCMGNLASAYYAVGRHAEALKLRQETLALVKPKYGPRHPATIGAMKNVAESLVVLHRAGEAIPIIDELIELGVGIGAAADKLARLFSLRLQCLEEIRDAAGCIKTAEMWEKLKRTGDRAAYCYNAACFRAVAAALLRTDKSASAAKQADAEADQAMKHLKEAVASGFKDAAQIKADKDLDSLRGREDLKKLVADLEGDHPSNKAKP